MNRLLGKVFIALLVALAAGILFYYYRRPAGEILPSQILTKTWQGYKYYFISEEGRVKRPKDGDTVSEGQAYAMLRAAWMRDKGTFDLCYRWTENNLSRWREKHDHLLAWRWKDGQVSDWMPASDADIDYALSLLIAETLWPNQAPGDLAGYAQKAKLVMKDILRLLTAQTASGRLYLLPWLRSGGRTAPAFNFPQNPSYYSPAHFRIFYRHSGDNRWLHLIDTAYFMLETLAENFDGQKGVGLIPDWVSVDQNDQFSFLEGKNSGFGWEAVRVPWRVALDYFWFDSARARQFFDDGFGAFIVQKWLENGKIYCEYTYAGEALRPAYENPLFYSAYYAVALARQEDFAEEILGKVRSSLKKEKAGWVYQDHQEYFVNSLAWLSEVFSKGAAPVSLK